MKRSDKRSEKKLEEEIVFAIKLGQWLAWQPYVARYGRIQVGVLMSTILSMGTAFPAMGENYFSGSNEIMGFMLKCAMGACLLMCFCFILVIRGRTWAAWTFLLMLVFCLFSCLPLVFEFQHKVLALMTVAFPVIGLYWMSTRRYQRGLKILAVRQRMRDRGQLLI